MMNGTDEGTAEAGNEQATKTRDEAENGLPEYSGSSSNNGEDTREMPPLLIAAIIVFLIFLAYKFLSFLF